MGNKRIPFDYDKPKLDPSYLKRLKPVIEAFLHLNYRSFEVSGLENLANAGLPARNPTLFYANHETMEDPFVLGYAIRDYATPYYMAKYEFYVDPPISYVSGMLTRMGMFPIQRNMIENGEVDKAAMMFAFRRLKEGNSMAIFPSGTTRITYLAKRAMPKDWSDEQKEAEYQKRLNQIAQNRDLVPFKPNSTAIPLTANKTLGKDTYVFPIALAFLGDGKRKDAFASVGKRISIDDLAAYYGKNKEKNQEAVIELSYRVRNAIADLRDEIKAKYVLKK